MSKSIIEELIFIAFDMDTKNDVGHGVYARIYV